MARNNGQETATIARLKDVLEQYGAYCERWPASDRLQLDALLARDVNARRLLAEATALDGLLAIAPAGRATSALKDQIVAATLSGIQANEAPIPFRAPNRRNLARRTDMRDIWPVAVGLAASFAIGLYVGLADLELGLFQDAVQFAANGAGLEEGGPATEFISGMEPVSEEVL